MMVIIMANLESCDLNLFLVLDAVLTEQSATRAAARLHVTQSAVSNALARLRKLFDDPLVVRSGRGLVATPRGRDLAPRVAAAMAELRTVVGSHHAFDAAQSTRTFTLVCTDYEEIVLLPTIVECLAKAMPYATLRVVTMDYLLATDGLSTGDIDLLIGWPPAVPPRCHAKQLFADDGVCVVQRSHPTIRREITLEQFFTCSHIHVAVLGTDREVFEKAMPGGRGKRHVALSVPHFTVALLAAARTPYIATLPRRFVRSFGENLSIRTLPLPFRMPSAPIDMIWHERTHEDPGSMAVRALVAQAAGRVTSSKSTGGRRAPKGAKGTNLAKPA